MSRVGKKVSAVLTGSSEMVTAWSVVKRWIERQGSRFDGWNVSLAISLSIFVLAFTTRAAYAIWWQSTNLGGDEIEYNALALGLLERGEYTSQPGFLPTLYSPVPFSPTAFRGAVQ